VLALAVFSGVTISDFPSGARYFFDKARTLIAAKNPDPAGYGDDVGSYLTGDLVQKAVQRFDAAFEVAAHGEDAALRGYIPDAFSLWRRLFGDYFPAYG
jgi:hypothetical protein